MCVMAQQKYVNRFFFYLFRLWQLPLFYSNTIIIYKIIIILSLCSFVQQFVRSYNNLLFSSQIKDFIFCQLRRLNSFTYMSQVQLKHLTKCLSYRTEPTTKISYITVTAHWELIFLFVDCSLGIVSVIKIYVFLFFFFLCGFLSVFFPVWDKLWILKNHFCTVFYCCFVFASKNVK